MNVHPTKKEVHFLHEELLLSRLHAGLTDVLLHANESRSFQVQTTLLPLPPAAATVEEPLAVVDQQGWDEPLSQASSQGGQGSDFEMAAAPGGLPYRTDDDDDDIEDCYEDKDEQARSTQAHAGGARSTSRGGGFSSFSNFSGSSNSGGSSYSGAQSKPRIGKGSIGSYGLSSSSSRATSATGTAPSTTATAPSKLVRTDPTLVRINTVFKPAASTTTAAGGGSVATESTPLPADSILTGRSASASVSAAAESAEACECPEPVFSLPTYSNTATDTITDGISTSNTAQNADGEDGEDGKDGGTAAPSEADSNIVGTSLLNAVPNVGTVTASSIPGAFAMNCLCCGKGARRGRKRPHSDSASADAIDVADADLGVQSEQLGTGSGSSSMHQKLKPLQVTSCQFLSIRALLQRMEQEASSKLQQILKQHTLVGPVNSAYSLLQHGTKLLMVDHERLLRCMFYQTAVKRFGEMERIELVTPVNILQFLTAAASAAVDLEVQMSATCSSNSNEDNGGGGDGGGGDGSGSEARISAIAGNALALLCDKAEMLDEYFRIRIDPERGELLSLPCLVEGHRPLAPELPMFLLRLCTEVNWLEEQPCFHSIATELARYYSKLETTDVQSVSRDSKPLLHHQPHQQPPQLPLLTAGAAEMLESLLLPALRLYLTQPPRAFEADHTMVQVAALEQLYKVFERC